MIRVCSSRNCSGVNYNLQVPRLTNTYFLPIATMKISTSGYLLVLFISFSSSIIFSNIYQQPQTGAARCTDVARLLPTLINDYRCKVNSRSRKEDHLTAKVQKGRITVEKKRHALVTFSWPIQKSLHSSEPLLVRRTRVARGLFVAKVFHLARTPLLFFFIGPVCFTSRLSAWSNLFSATDSSQRIKEHGSREEHDVIAIFQITTSNRTLLFLVQQTRTMMLVLQLRFRLR